MIYTRQTCIRQTYTYRPMPTLISEVEVKLEQTDMTRRKSLYRSEDENGFIVPPTRKPGLHLSGLLRYVATTAKLIPEYEQLDPSAMPLQWAMGQAWEEFCASLVSGQSTIDSDFLWQPLEVEDPVIMNCDGITFGPSGTMLEEFKCNRSKRIPGDRFISKQYRWSWLHQAMGYCLGYDTDTVRWHVLYLMEFPEPKYIQYIVQFSPKELSDMNRMIENNRDAAIAAGYEEK